jgi:hypothetical protein
MGRIELTDEQVNPLNYMFDLAFSDQATYLGDGNFAADYGAEWPEVAQSRASLCRTIAQLTTAMGQPGDQERWKVLAGDFEDTLVLGPRKKGSAT